MVATTRAAAAPTRYKRSMPTFSRRISAFVRGPKGQQFVQRAKQAANNPQNRAKIQQLTSRFTKRGGGGHGPTTPPRT